jgi:hypothetical protein
MQISLVLGVQVVMEFTARATMDGRELHRRFISLGVGVEWQFIFFGSGVNLTLP